MNGFVESYTLPPIVYAALPIAEFVKFDFSAIALTVEVTETVIGVEYRVEPDVGSEPSVV